MNWINLFLEKFQNIEVKVNEFLKEYTYTKTGGICDVIAFPANIEEVKNIVLWIRENHVPLTILGNASNVIVQDNGIKGIVVMFDKMSHITINDTLVSVDSGVKLVDLSKVVLEHSLTGLEFACGIPGNMGGGVFMNAGAYGGELKDIIHSVTVIDLEGRIKEYSNKDMAFGYRYSKIQETKEIILNTTLKLEHGEKEKIAEKMNELTILRESKQPLEYPSCGSVFKRPTGYFAGQLIQNANLQGYRIGGVEVSKKHAGFIVNIDNGTASDYKKLIEHVQKVVFKKFNVLLETEVKFIGEE